MALLKLHDANLQGRIEHGCDDCVSGHVPGLNHATLDKHDVAVVMTDPHGSNFRHQGALFTTGALVQQLLHSCQETLVVVVVGHHPLQGVTNIQKPRIDVIHELHRIDRGRIPKHPSLRLSRVDNPLPKIVCKPCKACLQ